MSLGKLVARAACAVMAIGAIVAFPANVAAASAAWSTHPSADETKSWRDVEWSPELKFWPLDQVMPS